MGNGLKFNKKEEKSLIIENPNKYRHKVDYQAIENPKTQTEEIKKLQQDLVEMKKLRRREYLAYRNEFDKSEKKALQMLGPEKKPKEVCLVAKSYMIECLQENPKETLNCQKQLTKYIDCVRNKTS